MLTGGAACPDLGPLFFEPTVFAQTVPGGDIVPTSLALLLPAFSEGG
ncbi:hypothetical protein [Nocardia camponoti]|uniref:Uncharacterized protein n=1 Tax=Nocardia camponoti TaxID=1616106 RepID=A0A917QPL9_9NOCA|nr:hypothetical protein [Nocardia camponoti]GGK62288.1 hypothetical protein GCM10011591_38130 [Nocardia camponoti]